MTESGEFEQEITELSPLTEYEFRAVVEWENEGTRINNGSIRVFNTSSPPIFNEQPIKRIPNISIKFNRR